MKKILLFLGAAVLLAGCATVETSRQGGRTMVSVANNGWYLFNCIPIASGDPASPNTFSTKFFTQTVTLRNNIKMLDYAMRKEGATGYKEVVSRTSDETYIFILLKRHSCMTSAELVRDVEPLWKMIP